MLNNNQYQELVSVAELNNNTIPANLIKEMGYELDNRTLAKLEEQGITISEDINENDDVTRILTEQECLYYVSKAQNGDEDAATKLAKAFDKYFFNNAYRLCSNHLTDMQDVMSEGKLGLMIAIQKYNPKESLYFAGYAKTIMHRYMYKAANKSITSVKIPEDKEIATLKLMSYERDHNIESWTDVEIASAAKNFDTTVANIKAYISYFNYFNMGYIDTVNTMEDEGYKGTIYGTFVHKDVDRAISSQSAEAEYFDTHQDETVESTLAVIKRDDDRAIFADSIGFNEDEYKYNVVELCDKYDMSRHYVETAIKRAKENICKAFNIKVA